METDFIAWLVSRLPADQRLEVPPGDDAAVLRPPAHRRTVVTVDMLMEGTDFVLGPDCSARAIGHKALAVSLSDLAAMGARPEAAVVAVALPRHGGDTLGREIEVGIEALAAEHGVTLAGGDTNAWDGPLVISTTAIGSVRPGAAWRRDGARAGDVIVVTPPPATQPATQPATRPAGAGAGAGAGTATSKPAAPPPRRRPGSAPPGYQIGD